MPRRKSKKWEFKPRKIQYKKYTGCQHELYTCTINNHNGCIIRCKKCEIKAIKNL